MAETERARPDIDLDALAADVDLEDDVDFEEELDVGAMGSSAWLVKVPRFLAERWAEHAASGGQGVELGRMRVYNADVHGKRRIEITVPTVPSLPTVPSNYKVDIRNPNATNMYVLDELSKPEVIGSEKLEDSASTPPTEGPSSQAGNAKGKGRQQQRRARVARRPRITGTVAHECVIQPVVDSSYKAVMRARQQRASKPKRTIKQLETDAATANRMASGVATGQQATKFAALTRNRAPAKTTTEKFTRMPRTALLDLLFDGFTRYTYWSMKSLREATKQPEAYLKEVLSEIAILLRNGPYTGHWILKDEYKKLNSAQAAEKILKAEGDDLGAGQGEGGSASQEMKDAGEDDEDEEMEEMEEVV